MGLLFSPTISALTHPKPGTRPDPALPPLPSRLEFPVTGAALTPTGSGREDPAPAYSPRPPPTRPLPRSTRAELRTVPSDFSTFARLCRTRGAGRGVVSGWVSQVPSC